MALFFSSTKWLKLIYRLLMFMGSAFLYIWLDVVVPPGGLVRTTIEIPPGNTVELHYRDYFARDTNPERNPHFKVSYGQTGQQRVGSDVRFQVEDLRDNLDIILTVENGQPSIHLGRRSFVDRIRGMLY